MTEIGAPAGILMICVIATWMTERPRVRWWIVGALLLLCAIGASTWAMRPLLASNTLALILWGTVVAETLVWTGLVFRDYMPHTEPQAPEAEQQTDGYASTTRVYKYVGRDNAPHNP